MVYQFKSGRGQPVDAQAVGQELARIHEDHGTLLPSLVVQESKPKRAVLHKCFEWDDQIAAQEHRIHQARSLINCVHIVPENNPAPVQAFINVRVHEDIADDPYENRGRAYVPADEVVANPDLREQHLAHIRSRLKNLRAQYSGFIELAKVWDAVDEVCS